VSRVRFSIIITSYNQREFIQDAVDSAISQRPAGAEIIVVDDGSTDGSQEVLKQYGGAIQLVCSQTNQGVCAARNSGAALARGEFLAFLDGDDAFVPWALHVYARIVQEMQPKMILGRMRRYEGQLPAVLPGDMPHDIRVVEYRDYLQKDRPFDNSASALVIDRASFDSVEGWSRDIFPMEDQDLTLRLGDCGRTIQVLSPPTTLYRSHADNITKKASPCVQGLHRIIHRNRAGCYPGGKRLSFARRAVIGGPILYWVNKARRAGHYREAWNLLMLGLPYILAAVIRRLTAILKGRQPCQTIEMGERVPAG